LSSGSVFPVFRFLQNGDHIPGVCSNHEEGNADGIFLDETNNFDPIDIKEELKWQKTTNPDF